MNSDNAFKRRNTMINSSNDFKLASQDILPVSKDLNLDSISEKHHD